MALCYLCGLAWPRSAQGESREPRAREVGLRPLIVLIRQPGDELLMVGVRSEALRFGWEVRDAALEPNEPSRDVPVALIRYLEASHGAHLWIRAAGQHASPVEEWIVRIGGDPDDVLAIRIVEILRAHFLLEPRPAAILAGNRRSPSELKLPGSQPPVLWGSLAIGCAGYGSPGGLDPMGGFALGAKIGLRGWIAGVFGAWQLGSSTVREPEGSASIRTFGAMAYVGRQSSLSAHFDGFVGIGAAVWEATIQGVANPPYVPRSSTVWTVGPSATLGLESALFPSLRVGLALHGGATVPPLSVQFVQREAAHWGAPFGLLALYGALQF